VADLRRKTWPTISKPADLTHSSISQSAVALHRVAAFCFTRYSLNSPYLGDQRVHVVPFDQEMLRPLGLTLPVGPAKNNNVVTHHVAAAGLALLVGYRDTTTGRHAHARRFAVMIPASTKALTRTLPRSRSMLVWLPSPRCAIVPGDAPSSITNTTFYPQRWNL